MNEYDAVLKNLKNGMGGSGGGGSGGGGGKKRSASSNNVKRPVLQWTRRRVHQRCLVHICRHWEEIR